MLIKKSFCWLIIDKDECIINVDKCNDVMIICLNSVGGYFCFCKIGY